jgi:hypothetical protein|tara:strand:- start:1291 stop:1905 length:615 start_codon:yes stop_codon:yes gene_type:complete
MSVPSQKDVSMMANLMKVMNGETVKLQEDTTSTNPNHVDISPGVKRADVDAMAKIMAGFNEATTSVAHKVKKTITESTKTEKGVKVGAFSVEKNKEGRYDILDTRSDSVLFEDIQLYETVCCIANHLNEGKTINSQEIMEIIRINALFERNYTSAIQHKNSYQVAKRATNEGRMDIAQARFSQSKHEAGKYKRKISNLYENIIL